MQYPRINPLRLVIEEIAGMSPVPSQPVDAATLREHCKANESDDDLLDLYQSASVAWAEGALHRTIIQREHVWTLRDFPRTGNYEIVLPRGKTISVTSIQYSDDGSLVELTGPTSTPAGDDYQEDLTGPDGGVIRPPRGESWPSVDYDVPAPVIITFQAGYETIPEEIQAAIMFDVCDRYEHKGTQDAASDKLPVFRIQDQLISGYRLDGFY